MNPQDDPNKAELRQLFAARQRRDEDAAPGFERLLRRPARARVGRWSWAAAAALLLILIAGGIVWRARFGETPPRTAAIPGQPTLATWKAPTDFLLNVPGGELLSSTPRFPDPSKEIL
jgi:hypothetical protein